MPKKTSKSKNLKRQSRLSSKQLSIFVLIFAIVGGITIWRSFAASCKTNNNCASGPWHLVSENMSSSLNPSAPAWCLNEDDVDTRYYSGSLNGNFSSTYQECDNSKDFSGGIGWNAGGEGLEADVTVSGTLTDLTITDPGGIVHHAVKMNSTTTKGKGSSSSHYAVCVVPPYYLQTSTGTNPIAGGVYTITLSGQITSATYETQATMAYPPFQKDYCPASEQNLVPLPAPTNLTAQAASSTTVNLSWSGYCGTTSGGYNLGCSIYRNGVKVGTYASTTSGLSDANSYTDTGLQAHTTYSYTVQSYDQWGDTSALSNTASATTF